MMEKWLSEEKKKGKKSLSASRKGEGKGPSVIQADSRVAYDARIISRSRRKKTKPPIYPGKGRITPREKKRGTPNPGRKHFCVSARVKREKTEGLSRRGKSTHNSGKKETCFARQGLTVIIGGKFRWEIRDRFSGGGGTAEKRRPVCSLTLNRVVGGGSLRKETSPGAVDGPKNFVSIAHTKKGNTVLREEHLPHGCGRGGGS